MGLNCGSASRQRAIALGQRGWNRQPEGISAAFGIAPLSRMRVKPPGLAQVNVGDRVDIIWNTDLTVTVQ